MTEADYEKRTKELTGEINVRAYADIREIEKAFGKHMGEMEEILSKAAGEGYTLGDKVAQTELGIGLSFTLVKPETVTYMKGYRDSLKDGGTVIKGEWVPWLEDYGKRTRNEVWKTIDEGIKATESHTKIAARLETVMGRSKSSALRIARTEVARAQTEGTMARMREAGVTRVQWLLGPTPCEVCDSYGGEEYDIDDLPEEIPVHPNCACGLRAIIDPYSDYTDEAENQLRDANFTEKTATADIGEIADELGADFWNVGYIDPRSGELIKALDYRLKELEALKRKIGQLYVQKILDPTVNRIPAITEIGREITDTLRYTVTFKPDEYVSGTAAAVRKLLDTGYEQVKQLNLWETPSAGGQKGIIAVFRAPTGTLLEVQFHTQASYEAMSLGLTLTDADPALATLIRPGGLLPQIHPLLSPLPTEPVDALKWAAQHGLNIKDQQIATNINGDMVYPPRVPMTPKILNEINVTQAEYRNAGVDIKFNITNAKMDDPGFYVPSTGDIYINVEAILDKELNPRGYQLYRINNGGVPFTAGEEKTESTVRHEMAHRLQAILKDADPTAYDDIKNLYLTDAVNYREKTRLAISNYAVIKNEKEYFAEYWTKITMSDYTPGSAPREQEIIAIVNRALKASFKAANT